MWKFALMNLRLSLHIHISGSATDRPRVIPQQWSHSTGSGPKHSLIYPFYVPHVCPCIACEQSVVFTYFYSYQDATVNIKYICLHIQITQTNSQISSQVSVMQSWNSYYYKYIFRPHAVDTFVQSVPTFYVQSLKV